MENNNKSEEIEIQRTLLKMAHGYEVEEKEVIVNKQNKETGRMKIIKRYIPPDLKAIREIKRLKAFGQWLL